ncbi:unnamed protein product [Brassica rapa]|uniref:Uncharacterized protein n=1 Tax=Brassica campestris TaxID=3711 RepID=A0A3P6ARE3_BRACM|nr:unnamed protein product [Brassica rapa]VDC90253.1 unnamed protein product [Brassica rapa]
MEHEEKGKKITAHMKIQTESEARVASRELFQKVVKRQEQSSLNWVTLMLPFRN